MLVIESLTNGVEALNIDFRVCSYTHLIWPQNVHVIGQMKTFPWRLQRLNTQLYELRGSSEPITGGKMITVWTIFKHSTQPLRYFKHILLSYKTRQMDKTQVVNLWSLLHSPPFGPQGTCKDSNTFGSCWILHYCLWLWSFKLQVSKHVGSPLATDK